jgi:hypothetical protein
MSSETKQLAIIATVFFFPTAIVGWMLYPKSADTAIKILRLSIYISLLYLCCLGAYAVTEGSKIVEALATFF